jgi:uncharacterized protein YihD (DUF1040 family)
MDKIIEGMKFFDELLVEKGKMTRDDFAASRRALRRSYQDEMDKLATEYAVRNSIYRVGDKVIVYDVRMNFDKETYQVRENDIVGYE